MYSYYYLVVYSFDAEHRVVGPFDTEEECWESMLAEAQKEHRVDNDENGWHNIFNVSKDAGEITLRNYFGPDVDITNWFLFSIEL